MKADVRRWPAMRKRPAPRAKTPFAGLLAVLIAGLWAGCAGTQHFIDPEADLPYYERVGVISFNSLAQDRLAGEKVASIFMTELLTQDFAHVVDAGQFAAAMQRIRGNKPMSTPWSTTELRELCEASEVQGIFMGTVREYEMNRSGRESFPLVSLEARLIDGTTGRIVWSGSATRKGGPAFPLFGWRETHTLAEMAATVCRDILGTLP